jgi:5'-3' exonuclease
MYLKMIDNLEPYANMIKEEIRVCNREICKIEGVESIEDTPYGMECTYKYGYEKPND